MSPGVAGRLTAWMGIAACVTLAACGTRLPANASGDESNPLTTRGASSRPAIETAPRPARVLLIPLDDRPPCLQFVALLAPVGDATIIAPPRTVLGRFTVPGDAEAILRWLDGQDLAPLDAVIVSTDMLAHGGLVASRISLTPDDTGARRRVEAIARIKQRRPDLPVYAFSVIMRLAPTADGRNEAWREPVARWAERSPLAEAAAEVRALEARIPTDVLAAYTRARTRNLAINLAAVRLVAAGAIDHLIVSQDDAKPVGVHVRDRERVLAEVERLGVQGRVAVQPGADEVALLLLSRALMARVAYRPRVAVTFAPATSGALVAPFEDRPLGATVAAHIAAAGGVEVQTPAEADAHLFVRASRLETSAGTLPDAVSTSTGPTRVAGVSPATDAAAVSALIDTGRPVIVADIDMSGRVQGADPAFTDALVARGALLRLGGYAAWNTAGNTLGTAIPHGLIHALALARLMTTADRVRNERLAEAQVTLLLHRVVDDDLFHARVRQAVAQRFPSSAIGDPAARTAALEHELREALGAPVRALWSRLVNTTVPIGPVTLVPIAMSDVAFTLPWGRTFEAEIAFRVEVSRRLP